MLPFTDFGKNHNSMDGQAVLKVVLNEWEVAAGSASLQDGAQVIGTERELSDFFHLNAK